MRGKNRKRNFHAHGSDFTAHRGRSVGVFLHIPRGREGARRKQATARWGVWQAPLTPNSLILRSFHLAPRYKSQDFVGRDPREMANLPVSQIFKT